MWQKCARVIHFSMSTASWKLTQYVKPSNILLSNQAKKKSSDMYTWIFICPIGALLHFMYNIQEARGSWMPLFKYPLVQAEEFLHGRLRQAVMDILGLSPHTVSLLSQKLSKCFLRGEYFFLHIPYSRPSCRYKVYFTDLINGYFDAILISICGIMGNFCSHLTQ